VAQTVVKKKPASKTSRVQPPKPKAKSASSTPGFLDLLWQRHFAKLGIAALCLAAAAALYLFYSILSTNGYVSFPVDDAWIHLTFAKTLATTGRFAYGPLNTATSGSTSPLFTFIEAVIFLFTNNEFAAALIPSILFFALSVFLFYNVVREFTALPWIPLAASILFVATPSLLVISNWGMETSLVIALLLYATLAYKRSQWITLAVALGLAFWARPDTIVFDIAIAIDHFFTKRVSNTKPALPFYLIVIGFVVLYAIFNLVLSGTILPNTFSAKLAYYKNGNAGFWAQLWPLLAGNRKMITFILAAIGTLWMLTGLLKQRTNNVAGHALAVLYPIGMIALYRWKLPYLYQDGRYLIPVIPFILLLAAFGASKLAQWFGKRSSASTIIVGCALLLVASVGAFSGMSEAAQNLAFEDSYIHNLQVQTAQWCANNLPTKAVIATHDIGALGYYSNRRVVDLVGLADPDMIKYLSDPIGAGHALHEKGCTHAALLDNWYEITNENTVYVDAPPASEIMRVYTVSDSTKFTGPKVLPIHRYLYEALAGGDASAFPEAMREATMYEPNNPLTYTLGGEILLKYRKFAEAADAFRKALALFPNSERAQAGLSQSLQFMDK